MSVMKQNLKIKIVNLKKLVMDQVEDWDSYPENKKYRVKCPFCDEDKTPALSILHHMRVGICFRCEMMLISDLSNNNIDTGLDLVLSAAKVNKGLLSLNEEILSVYDTAVGIENEYLHRRNPYVEDWGVYNIRQGPDFVLTPYYLFSNFVYYQRRSITTKRFTNPK